MHLTKPATPDLAKAFGIYIRREGRGLHVARGRGHDGVLALYDGRVARLSAS